MREESTCMRCGKPFGENDLDLFTVDRVAACIRATGTTPDKLERSKIAFAAIVYPFCHIQCSPSRWQYIDEDFIDTRPQYDRRLKSDKIVRKQKDSFGRAYAWLVEEKKKDRIST